MAVKNDSLTMFRRFNKLTQEDLAAFLSVSKSFVSQIENGRVDLPYEQRQRILQNDQGWDVTPLVGPVTVNGDGNAVNNGHDQTVSADAGLVAALREAQAQNAKSQEQIDRLLGIIEGFQKCEGKC